MAKTISELCIDKIESGIRAIRLGLKKPSEVELNDFFKKLAPLNVGMHDDLMGKYTNVVKDYNRKNEKKEVLHEA
jgi:hypothetical protein